MIRSLNKLVVCGVVVHVEGRFRQIKENKFWWRLHELIKFDNEQYVL